MDMHHLIQIMLVDDHSMVRVSTRLALAQESRIQVIAEAADGLSAYRHLRNSRTHPSLILMDVSMPVMDGFEATAKIAEAFPSIGIIGWTSHDDAGTSERMIGAGAITCVSKTAPFQRLIDTVVSTAIPSGIESF